MKNSLKKYEDFRNCYSHGKSYANAYLILYVCGNGTDGNRLGISVSKKVGNSVVRHHICRLVRESYRLHKEEFNSGLDLAVVARVKAKDAGFHEIESALLNLAGRAKLYRRKKPVEAYDNDKKNSDCNDQALS
ncbi:ribonuclease P protein component [Lachnoclostridium sp. Marseille-P6806]|uniref:ribonuclease P protein component n=1 Tax=Lachnoclostridium sp. Marseille-P6806 TaxID=2364793 RepID=UPI0010320DF2|nr:ribonuclease P protein component [Lachnoclostridium sp. Marseille-P6806]